MGVGRQLMRNVVVRKAYDQKESGREARERRAKPVSIM